MVSELTCKVVFYSALDEEIFFEWLNKIPCIKGWEGAGDELYLDLVERELEYEEMKNIIALFFRYKIDMTQLVALVNDKNKAAVTPWEKYIYKEKK